MVQEFTPTGTGARQAFTVINDGSTPLAVRVEMVHREVDIYGEETLRDASALFTVFPQQMVVQPNSQQIVRVQWRGPAAVAQEQAFRIIARQLPVDFQRPQQDSRVSINIMFVYQGAVYVTPPQPRVDLVLDSVKRTVDQEGNPRLTFEFHNRGNVHTIVENPVITVKSTSGGRVVSDITLSGEQLPGIHNSNVLAGNRRLVSIPWPDALSEGDLDATFSYTRR